MDSLALLAGYLVGKSFKIVLLSDIARQSNNLSRALIGLADHTLQSFLPQISDVDPGSVGGKSLGNHETDASSSTVTTAMTCDTSNSFDILRFSLDAALVAMARDVLIVLERRMTKLVDSPSIRVGLSNMTIPS